jgi:hypothetical protein
MYLRNAGGISRVLYMQRHILNISPGYGLERPFTSLSNVLLV